MSETYNNRIKKCLDMVEPPKAPDNGKVALPPQAANTHEPEITCEYCIHQKEGFCHRYPQRYVVKQNGVFLPYCGEFDDGLCDECTCD